MVTEGDFVLKGADVYRITDMRAETIGGMPEEEYFILEQAFSTKRTTCTAHVPVRNADNVLKPIPTQQEIEVLLEDSREVDEMGWIDNRNKRIDAAKEVLHSGDLIEVIKLERTYRKRTDEQADRRLSGKDQELCGQGYSLLTHVTAASLDITPDEASEKIEEILTF